MKSVCLYRKNSEKESEILEFIVNFGFELHSSDIYVDLEQSNFNLQKLKEKLILSPKILIINSILTISEDLQIIQTELSWLIENNITAIFRTIPSTFDFENNKIALSTIKETLKWLESNGTIKLTYPDRFEGGRKKIIYPENWETLYKQFENKEITAVKFMELAGLKKGTFYHLLTEYKKLSPS